MEDESMIGFQPRGMIVPMVTPFDEDGELDELALRRLTRRLIDAGIHGVFPVGTSGEFYALSNEEGYRAIEVVVEETAGRVPVYAGAGAITTGESARMARQAEQLGADAIVVITPFYITPTQEELYDHYKTIAASTSLPVIPYNNPSRASGVNLEPVTVARLAAIPNLVGIKDSSGNLGQTGDYISQCPRSFSVFQGRDDLFYPSLAIGAVGGIAAIGNVVPEAVVDLYESFMAGDLNRACSLQYQISPLRRALSWSTYPSVLKAAMALVGEPVGDPRLPVKPLDVRFFDPLRKILEQIVPEKIYKTAE
jgi:4-hydroxy-tetrahydrodipicolinate synthase